MARGRSVGPGDLAIEAEIVGIGFRLGGKFVRFEDLKRNRVLLRIGDGFVQRIEIQAHLLAHVRGSGPAHQRVDLASARGLELELPSLGAVLPRLHRVSCGLKDADQHGTLRYEQSSFIPTIPTCRRQILHCYWLLSLPILGPRRRNIMRISRRELGGILAAVLAVRPRLAAAQSTTVESIANYWGGDRQAMLEAGARAERGLLLYTTGTQIEPLIQGFERKYPYLKVTVQRGTQADIASRALAEYRVGYRKLDMFELSSEGLILIRDANILQPFRSPQGAAFDDAAIEPARHWVVVGESYTGIGINTKAIPAARAPKTYDDLLAPEWRGRMAMSGSISTASNFVATLVLTRGEDFVRKLGEQNIRIYPVTARALANLMIAGAVTLSPTIYNSHVEASAAKGAPLAWVAPGPGPVTDTAVALARGAPSPHASMLLIDYLMSQEGQRIYGQLGYGSARRDMMKQASKKPGKKLYLGNRPDYVREIAQWSKLYRDVFLRR